MKSRQQTKIIDIKGRHVRRKGIARTHCQIRLDMCQAAIGVRRPGVVGPVGVQPGAAVFPGVRQPVGIRVPCAAAAVQNRPAAQIGWMVDDLPAARPDAIRRAQVKGVGVQRIPGTVQNRADKITGPL